MKDQEKDIDVMVGKAQIEIARILKKLEEEANVTVHGIEMYIEYDLEYVNVHMKEVSIDYKKNRPIIWCCD